jgi:hypothetical protein
MPVSKKRRSHKPRRAENRLYECFYLQHTCGHKITWILNSDMFPRDIVYKIPAYVRWQHWTDLYTSDCCPWCKNIAPPDVNVIKQTGPTGGPVEYVWQGWAQECESLPGIKAPNPPPKD